MLCIGFALSSSLALQAVHTQALRSTLQTLVGYCTRTLIFTLLLAFAMRVRLLFALFCSPACFCCARPPALAPSCLLLCPFLLSCLLFTLLPAFAVRVRLLLCPFLLSCLLFTPLPAFVRVRLLSYSPALFRMRLPAIVRDCLLSFATACCRMRLPSVARGNSLTDPARHRSAFSYRSFLLACGFLTIDFPLLLSFILRYTSLRYTSMVGFGTSCPSAASCPYNISNIGITCSYRALGASLCQYTLLWIVYEFYVNVKFALSEKRRNFAKIR